MKKDIESHKDIKLLVDEFYQKAVADKNIGHIFTDVAKMNFEHHLPIMYAFWDSVLLGEARYVGNPMDAHFKLNEKITLTADHFNTWKLLFTQTVDHYFVGKIASLAKEKAMSIADLMFFKIHNHYNSPGVAKPKGKN